MNGNMIMKVYVLLMDELMGMDVDNAYVLTNNDTYINFNPADFNECLGEILQQPGLLSQIETQNRVNIDKAVREMLRIFKNLGLIICEEKKFTNVQWIQGKARRVITVDCNRFKSIAELKW